MCVNTHPHTGGYVICLRPAKCGSLRSLRGFLGWPKRKTDTSRSHNSCVNCVNCVSWRPATVRGKPTAKLSDASAIIHDWVVGGIAKPDRIAKTELETRCVSKCCLYFRTVRTRKIDPVNISSASSRLASINRRPADRTSAQFRRRWTPPPARRIIRRPHSVRRPRCTNLRSRQWSRSSN